MNGPPPSDAPPPPAHRRGSPRQGATPLMETVRVTAPDLERRAALEKTRSRLLVAAGGFMLLFGAVVAKLATATILFPMLPKLPPKWPACRTRPPWPWPTATRTHRRRHPAPSPPPTARAP